MRKNEPISHHGVTMSHSYAAQVERLHELERELSARIEREVHETFGEEGRLEADSEERAVQLAHLEADDRIADGAALELRRVRAALLRHASGAYGRCAACDTKIPAARLEALPFAIHCLACAEKLGAS